MTHDELKLDVTRRAWLLDWPYLSISEQPGLDGSGSGRYACHVYNETPSVLGGAQADDGESLGDLLIEGTSLFARWPRPRVAFAHDRETWTALLDVLDTAELRLLAKLLDVPGEDKAA